jgi:epoxyqueuosine reductase
MPILTSDLKARLVAQALAEGFRNAKITRPDAVPQVPAQLDAFLRAGYHGQMTWMETRKEWRAAPQVLWPEARSVVMLG